MAPDPTDVVQDQRENNASRPGGITGKGFLPGRSGNPSGRPKGRSLTARLREALEAFELDGRAIVDGRQAADLVVEGLIKGAIAGDPRCAKILFDRTEGKVPLTVDVTDGTERTVVAALHRLTDGELDQLERITGKLADEGDGQAHADVPAPA